MDGILLLDKSASMTSFGVVSRVRRRLSEKAGKKIKVGHTGTLDPFATGLMILVVGKACKSAGTLSKLDKAYEATIKLGQISSTGDPEGDITAVSGSIPTQLDIESVLKQFVGTINQLPPIYSAIKINGQRAYKLARQGEAIEMPEREITVYSIDLLKYTYPHLIIQAHVSSGTYIRSLAQDIGKALGTGAYTQALRRTQVGEYQVEKAIMWDNPLLSESIQPL